MRGLSGDAIKNGAVERMLSGKDLKPFTALLIVLGFAGALVYQLIYGIIAIVQQHWAEGAIALAGFAVPCLLIIQEARKQIRNEHRDKVETMLRASMNDERHVIRTIEWRHRWERTPAFPFWHRQEICQVHVTEQTIVDAQE